MSWNRTHEWWQALREVLAEVELRQDGALPWQPRYAEIFGDRAGLRSALAYRWTLLQQAQVDGNSGSPTRSELAERNRGLLLVLDDGQQPRTTSAPVRQQLVTA